MNPPLAVIRYLAELDAALAARNAPDRDQIVTQVGEHISQALADVPDPSDADIAAVLGELGDPLRIADEAAGPAWTGSTSPSSDADRTERYSEDVARRPAVARQPVLARSWIPVVAAALWVLGAAQSLGPMLLTTTGPFIAIPASTMLITTLANIPLIASVVVVLCSSLFRPAGRVVWALAVPAAVLIELAVAQGNLRYSQYSTDATFAWVLTVVAPIAAVCAAAWIAVRAYRRAPTTLMQGAAPRPGPAPTTP